MAGAARGLECRLAQAISSAAWQVCDGCLYSSLCTKHAAPRTPDTGQGLRSPHLNTHCVCDRDEGDAFGVGACLRVKSSASPVLDNFDV